MSSLAYLITWSAVLTMGNFLFGYLVNSLNVIWDFTPCIYSFHPRNRRLVNTIGSTMFPLMVVMGGAISWRLARYGKRKTLIIAASMSILGSGISFIRSAYALVIWQGIEGLSFGLTNAVAPLFLFEIAKRKNIEYCVITIQFWINIGFAVPAWLKLGLPEFNPREAMSDQFCVEVNQNHIIWREIFAVVPIISFIQLMLLLFIFRKENPNYIEHCDEKAGSLSSSEEYDTDTMNAGINDSGDDLQQSFGRAETKMEKDTWANLWRKPERRKLLACCIIRGFHQLVGVNIILAYAAYFTFNNKLPELSLGFILSSIGVLFPFAGLVFLRKFGRKNLFMVGMFLTCLYCCILFQMTDYLTLIDRRVPIIESIPNFASFLLVLMFVITFWLTFATVPILYCSETLTDKGMAIVTMVHWGINSILTVSPAIMLMIIDLLGGNTLFRTANSFFFFIFSGMAMLGFFCTALFIKETKGRSRRELSEEFNKEIFNLEKSTKC